MEEIERIESEKDEFAKTSFELAVNNHLDEDYSFIEMRII